MFAELFPLNPYNEDSPNVKVTIKTPTKEGIFEVRRYHRGIFMYNLSKNELMVIKNGFSIENDNPSFTKSPHFKNFLEIQDNYNQNLILGSHNSTMFGRPYNSEILRRRTSLPETIRLSKSENSRFLVANSIHSESSQSRINKGRRLKELCDVNKPVIPSSLSNENLSDNF
jgi:hypothetical protein